MNSTTSAGSCPEINLANLQVVTSENAKFGLGFAVLSWCYFGIGLMWYYVRRKHSLYLQRRRFELVLLISLGLSLNFFSGIREYIGRENYPCALHAITPVGVVIFGFGIQILRGMLFYTTLKYKQKLSEISYWGFVSEPLYKDLQVIGKASHPRLQRSKSNLSTSDVFAEDSRQESHDLSSFEYKWDESESYQNTKEESKMPSALSWAKWLASSKFALIMASGHVILFILLAAIYAIRLGGCFGCTEIWHTLATMALSVVALVLGLATLYYGLSKKTLDPLWIRREIGSVFILSIAFASIGSLLFLHDPNGLEKEGIITWDYFVSGGFLLVFTLMVPVQVWISYDEEPDSEHSLETMIEFLHKPDGRQFFKQHLVKDLSIENYLFWREATNWKKDFQKLSQSTRIEGFLKLYHIFISPSSILSVNIAGGLRSSISAVVDDMTKNPDAVTQDVLDDAISDALSLMRSHSWPRFVDSDLYKQYRKQFANPRLTHGRRTTVSSLRSSGFFKGKGARNSTSDRSSYGDRKSSAGTRKSSAGTPWGTPRSDSHQSVSEIPVTFSLQNDNL